MKSFRSTDEMGLQLSWKVIELANMIVDAEF